MTDKIIKELGNKLLRRVGKHQAIEMCKANKWDRVLDYIEKLNARKGKQ